MPRTRDTVAALVAATFLGVTATPANAATLSVGPGQTYTAPCAAIAAAHDGDLIEIAAGLYSGDVCSIAASNLTLRGKGGLAHLDAAGKIAGGKAIWVIAGHDTTVENIEFSGAAVVDLNGAGIRQEGANLTVRGCYFHDNEDGILAGDNAASTITVEHSEFDHNGAGDGYSHNMYINHVKQFTLRGSWSHRAKVGQLVKSRALVTYLLYNRLTDEDGSASYEVDVPNGGTVYAIGNVIEQGPSSQNSNIVEIGAEGNLNPGTALFFVNNTLVNDLGKGTFILVGGGVTVPSVIVNNVFFGAGTVTNQAGAMLMSNLVNTDPLFVDAARFDYHLRAGSPAVDQGSAPGSGMGYALTPVAQYLHPAGEEGRVTVGAAIDIGAYEQGGGGPAPDLGGGAVDGSSAIADLGGAAMIDGGSSSDGSRASPGDGSARTGDAAGVATGGTPGTGCGCRTGGASDARSNTTLAAVLLLLLALGRRLSRRAGARIARR